MVMSQAYYRIPHVCAKDWRVMCIMMIPESIFYFYSLFYSLYYSYFYYSWNSIIDESEFLSEWRIKKIVNLLFRIDFFNSLWGGWEIIRTIFLAIESWEYGEVIMFFEFLEINVIISSLTKLSKFSDIYMFAWKKCWIKIKYFFRGKFVHERNF